MDNEKDYPDQSVLRNTDSREDAGEEAPNPTQTRDQRIQFIPTAKPERVRPSRGDEDASAFAARPTRRSQSIVRTQSIVSIPQVVSAKDKDRYKREKEQEKKNVNIDEHLMPHQDVAERYGTKINIDKPEDSFGLTSQKAEELLQQHGRNVLTPPKKRHPFLKYLDCLSSLFNLLLILAGVLEYILLGINYKDNFQNVSVASILPFGE